MAAAAPKRRWPASDARSRRTRLPLRARPGAVGGRVRLLPAQSGPDPRSGRPRGNAARSSAISSATPTRPAAAPRPRRLLERRHPGGRGPPSGGARAVVRRRPPPAALSPPGSAIPGARRHSRPAARRRGGCAPASVRHPPCRAVPAGGSRHRRAGSFPSATGWTRRVRMPADAGLAGRPRLTLRRAGGGSRGRAARRGSNGSHRPVPYSHPGLPRGIDAPPFGESRDR